MIMPSGTRSVLALPLLCSRLLLARAVVLVAVCFACVFTAGVVTKDAFGQAFTEDFNDNSQFAVRQGALGSDGRDNYFRVDDGANINKAYSGVTGSFLAAQDTDDPDIPNGAAPVQITWTDIDVSSLSNPVFEGLFGSVLDGSGDIDDDDFIRVEYNLDEQGYQSLIEFRNDGSSTNTPFQEDTDDDGVGEGTQLSSSAGTMKTFQKELPTGTSLDLRLTAHVDAGDEDFAVDAFAIKEAPAPALGFSASGDRVAEDDGSVQLSVELLGFPDSEVSGDVALQTGESSATAADLGGYATQTVSFAAGAQSGTTKNVSVSLTDDAAAEGEETAQFALTNVTAGGGVDGGSFDLEIVDTEVVINEVLADPPTGEAGDANADGSRDASDDEFVEIFNNSNTQLDLSGYVLRDGSSDHHVFPDNTTVAPRTSLVVFGGGSPAASLPGVVQTASGGDLGLSNDGDEVIIDKPDGQTYLTFSYGGEGGDDQSLTRDPDFTGDFVKHSDAAESGGALFSPGRRLGFAISIVGTAGFAAVGSEGADAGWRTLALPEAIDRGDLNANFNFDFDDLESSAVYTWNGAPADGGGQQWDALSNDNDPIAEGAGVALYFFDDADDPIGEPSGSKGPLVLTVPSIGAPDETDVTRSGLGEGQFVFLGNPYQSAFDLSALDMTAENGFQQTVQVWDPDAGAFISRDRMQAETVAAGQGFFVERSTPGEGATSLTFSSDGVQDGPGSLIGTDSSPQPASLARSTSAPKASVRSASVDLALTVTEASGDTLAQNRATVLFHEGAAADWDVYDATQLLPPGAEAHATLTSPLERSGQLARRTQAAEPFPEGPPAEVPLSARSVGVDGTAHIELLQAPDASGPIELIDAETGATVNLRAESYSFPLAAGDGSIESPSEARFTLRAGAGALPVELTRLTATPDAGGVLLEWTTASETRNAGFEIERQAVGEENAASGDWTTIGFVEGAGTTTEAQAYRFRAEDLPVGTHRFRLRQLDADGTATLSAPVTAAVRLAEAYRLTAPAPNPATTGATMRLVVRQPQAVRVAVYDVLGRAVRVLLDGPMSAQQPTTLRVGEGLPAGQYFVRAVGERFRATERLTIVR